MEFRTKLFQIKSFNPLIRMETDFDIPEILRKNSWQLYSDGEWIRFSGKLDRYQPGPVRSFPRYGIVPPRPRYLS